MRSQTKVVLGSLAGALAIHFGFAACGGDDRVNSPTDAGFLDALLDSLFVSPDAIAVVDAGIDAGAPDSGNCGCTIAKTITADEDSTQLLSGSWKAGLQNPPVKKIVEGPFVLTDATPGQSTGEPWTTGWGFSTQLTVEPTAMACSGGGVVLEQIGETNQNGQTGNVVHGGRFLIPSGEMLCAEGNLLWAGFRPYQ
jgi:hypothetical protein